MNFYADLHIHSRFSRATSKSLNLTSLATGAKTKGLKVIGTGDFTHPVWLFEIESELRETPGGLLVYPSTNDILFMLTAEVSTIYKQDGRVRKVHHLIGAPDIEAAKEISMALARIGNIKSDGRPIIGMSSRDLLDLVLTASIDAFIIPAHIWTPWFSALGSKSGFDSIEDCYLDLSPNIFACETGLSSDPPMNRMVTSLDRYFLVSNSDAHSADKLGREATIFDCEPGYHEILTAMRTGTGLEGTIEFFPEEGKYHLDGHRDCGVVLEPEETLRLKGICPVCGKPLTIGVQYRVHELADRFEGLSPKHRPFFSIIPLKEILGEVLSVGPASVKVEKLYDTMTATLGPELGILLDAPLPEIEKVAGEKAGLAVSRMREGRVRKRPGYDGVYGTISMLSDGNDSIRHCERSEAIPYSENSSINEDTPKRRTEQLRLFD
jgi:DNA helicase-2/ATP-dependent DNA helicase PcrA